MKFKVILFCIVTIFLQNYSATQYMKTTISWPKKSISNSLLTLIIIDKLYESFKNVTDLKTFYHAFHQLSWLTNHFTPHTPLYNKTFKEYAIILYFVCITAAALTGNVPKIYHYYLQLKNWILKNEKNLICAYFLHFRLLQCIHRNINIFFDDSFYKELSNRDLAYDKKIEERGGIYQDRWNGLKAYQHSPFYKKLFIIFFEIINQSFNKLFPYFPKISSFFSSDIGVEKSTLIYFFSFIAFCSILIYMQRKNLQITDVITLYLMDKIIFNGLNRILFNS